MTAAGSFRRRSPMLRTMEGGTTGAHGRRARKPAGQGSPVRSDSAGMSLFHLANYLRLGSLTAERDSLVEWIDDTFAVVCKPVV